MLPDRIEMGEALPVAKWQDDEYGAVLYVTREEIEPGDFPGDEYGHEIEYCRRNEDGSWIAIGGGGGGWVNPLSVPADLRTVLAIVPLPELPRLRPRRR